jgi:hypothetical protein
MERPGFEPPLCAMSTNRSLYAIYSQMPMDRYAILHRRMTERTSWQEAERPTPNRVWAFQFGWVVPENVTRSAM